MRTSKFEQMATAEEGGATANTISFSYGGGVGGKFRKKPLRRQTTPYDRPPTALRGNKDNNSSWLKKLVIQPASKLISYGADRFFAPLLRKRLPPPPPQPPVTEADVGDGVQGAVSQEAAQEPPGGGCSQPMISSSRNGISELEQLLKQRTFTRSEIDHLRELLQSRAVEVSLEDVGPKNEDSASDYARHQQFASGLLEENRDGGNISAFMSTPIVNSKVPEDDNASPAEIAKAYMGSRPSKVSPSVLGMCSRVGREDTGLLSSFPSASGSPIMALAKKTPNSMAAPVNGFITPRSRGRSAIYNMARTPYSKVHLTSNLKGHGISGNGYAGPSMSSSFLSPVDNDEKFESHAMRLKRRSSAIDDELGSVGPIRRIRQKPNLLASRLHHTTYGMGIGSHAKQKLPLIGEPSNKVSKDVGENENGSVPNSSYARVPPKSSEVATKILQHLEKMTPKEKSSESNLAAGREKTPLTLTSSMLSGKALRSMEIVDSSKLLDVQGDHKLGDRSNGTLADDRGVPMQKPEKVVENGPKESVAASRKWNPVKNNDSVVPLKASTQSTSATDSIVKPDSFQPLQKKRAFRMSAQEDYFEQDDDAHCNGHASRPFSAKGPTEPPLKDSKVAPFEEPKLVKPLIQRADESPLALISNRTTEPNPGTVTLGEVSAVVFLPASEEKPASEETIAASQSAVIPLSVAAFDKPKEANNPPLFSFSSKIVEKIASFPSESSNGKERKIESSSSLISETGSQAKIPESDKNYHLNGFKAGDLNGKSDPSEASNGPPLVLSPSPVSFAAASSNDTNQIIKDSAFPFTSSTSGGPTRTSTSTSTQAASSDSIFGLVAKASSLSGPVIKFGAPSVDPATSVSAASTTSPSEVADMGIKAEMVPSSGSSSSSSLSNPASFAAASSGSNSFRLGSTTSFSSPNNFQGSLFASASKALVPGYETGLQDTSTQSVSSAATLPAFGINSSSTSAGSSFRSEVFNPSSSFGFTPPASSSDQSALTPNSGPTSSVVNSTQGSAVSSSSGVTAPLVSFSFSSSTCPTNSAVALSSGSTVPFFCFSAPVTNTATASSSVARGTSSAIFSFGATSSASSSSAPTNTFGSSWQTPKSPIFGSSFTSPSPSTGFSTTGFGATSSSSNPIFPFTTASPSILSSPSASVSQQQPVFGNPVNSGFASASPDQMNAEDSMAEDPVQQPSATPSVSIFAQPAPSPTPAFAFVSSSVASQPSPIMFGGQQNQVVPPQNSSPFQASGSFSGGNFSLGSGGGDKSGRKIVKISRSKNRKK